MAKINKDMADKLAGLPAEKRLLLFQKLEEQSRKLQPGGAPIPVQKQDTGTYPLSFAQQRLWFVDQLEPGNPAYNMFNVVRLHGPLDVTALAQGFKQVVQRHQALRTTFQAVDGQPHQTIAPEAHAALKLVNLMNLAAEQHEAEVWRLAHEEARRPFDLAKGPLVRCTLLRLSDHEHVLLLTMHHIVSDGWSLGLLLREIILLGQAFAAGQPNPLPELALQYPDFAVWQRDWLQGEVLETQMRYWKEKLAGAPAALELPSDKPRPALQTSHGARIQVTISRELINALQALGRQEESTLFMVLLAAFQVLLSRYSGQDDILVGSPVAGRSRSELEGLIGLFVNDLVLRTDLSGNPSFRELLGRVRETCLGAYNHQDVPFEKLVDEIQVRRDLSRNPLFQVMFVLQNTPLNIPNLGGLSAEPMNIAPDTAQFDLRMSLIEKPEGLTGEIEYNTDLFEQSTIARMFEHFQVLLEGVVADPDRPLSDIPLLSSAEREQLLLGWNASAVEYPQDKPVHEMFEEQAQRTPEAVALVFEDQQLTYRELNERANQLAHYLINRGVGPDVLVGVCLERSLEMLVGLLGILKAGGAYVPLDPSFPKDRLAFMLADSQLPILLTQQGLTTELEPIGHQARMIRLDADWPEIAREAHTDPKLPGSPAGLAYVIYTSGSTGRPKGVQVVQQALANFLHSMRREPGISPNDRLLSVTTLSFDIAGLELYLPLIVGAQVEIVPHEIAADGFRLRERLKSSQATILQATPATWRLLLDAGWQETEKVKVLCGGEALSPALAGPLLSHATSLWNMYGPTETTVWSTLARIESAAGIAPIGQPIANTRVYVLDKYLNPTPVGVPGELYIGGDGLARGYLKRPDLTAEKFVPDPFAPKNGGDEGGSARLYRTGDQVRWRADGKLEYLGRIDFQVKVHGFRIELGEIESALGQHQDVRQAVVVVREDQPGDKRLVAYVVLNPGPEPAPADLRNALKAKLPDYMLPSAFVFLERLPLTPNGKVDRKALPAPERGRESTADHVAPRTPAEETLAQIWKEILKIERVGVHDNFFDLGGHSLLATQVVSRIRQAFNIELPLRALFQTSTVAELAEYIQTLQHLEPSSSMRVERPAQIPLSFAQQRLWFVDQLEPGSTAYNIFNAVRLRGPLDVRALEQGFQQVVARHESLRTTFQALDGGQPYQVISSDARAALQIVNLMDLPVEQHAAQVQRLAREEARRPFDLAKGPLVRCTLLRLGDSEHVLLLSMHHIISDGWSMGVLFREIVLLAQAFAAGQPGPLPELPIQYPDFALWQRSWLQGEVLDAQIGYWKKQLADAPTALELPTDHPRPAMQTFHGARLPISLSRELGEALHGLSRSANATLFMTLLAAFQTLLARYSRQNDILVGSPVAGRGRSELEPLIGFFVNTLVLRADLSGSPSFRELLRRVSQACLGAYEHQDLPFEKLVDELHVPRDLSRNPLFQAMFTLQNTPLNIPGLSGLSLESLPVEAGVAQFDLSLSLTETPNGLTGYLEYNTDLFEQETIARMAAHFQTLLEGIIAHPEQSALDLPLLGPAERRQILVDWNLTPSASPQEKCLHQLFEAQAAKTPDATALVFGTQELTYRELDERANQLAHVLRERGAGPDVLVGICLERSPEIVVGLLAILKAGGAYVPLDPNYPSERLGFMLEDAHISLVVSQHMLQSILPASERQTVWLDRKDWQERIAACPLTPPLNLTNPSNLAYVLFTSGTTGRPKGVALEHRNAAALIQWVEETYSSGELSGVLASTSIGFDLSVYEIFGTLSLGGCVILAENVLQLPVLAHAERVRLVNTVPSAMAELLRQGGLPHTVETVNLAGEALPTQLVDALYGRAGIRRVIDAYGPTENTTYSTFVVRQPGAQPTIGRPLPHWTVYILDGNLQPVPVGVPGELYIGGAGVARGYLNRPELTAEKFVPDPFAGSPATADDGPLTVGKHGLPSTAQSPQGVHRLYKTGDLARWRPNGNIEYLGRIDHQVKLRGFRIELGEIESTLRQQAGVREAVVIVREDHAGDKRLVAYLVTDAGRVASVSELRSGLKDRLPDYMIPAAFVFLEQLPLTPNGKIDRKALPAPDQERNQENVYVAPRTPAEETLAAIWAEVLGIKQVGIHDNFFELGGHSLLATQVISRMRQAFNAEFPLRTLFQTSSVAELAQTIQTARRIESLPLLPLSRPQNLPLSFAQQRLWFVDQLEPGNIAYNMFNAMRLHGQLDIDALAQGFQQVVQRHEALRTTFQAVDGQPHQLVAPSLQVDLPLLDLSTLPQAEQETEARRLASEEARRPFDLAAGPLVRCCLLKLAGDEHILLLNMHHIISDGWSMGVLFREIVLLGQAFATGTPNPLPELSLQYPDFALWQREWLQGDVLAAQTGYWKKQLAGIPAALELPTDFPRPSVQTFHGARLPVSLPRELSDALQGLSQQEGGTLFMILLAAFQALLARYSGQADIVVGSPIANRNRSELEGMIGFFVNTLVLRTDLSGNPTFHELLGRVREVCLGAYEHQDLPFEKLVDEVQVARDLSRNPLFQVMFILQNTPQDELDLGSLHIQPLEIEPDTAQFDLRMTLHETPTGLGGHLEYNTDLFEPETVVLLVDLYRQILEGWLANPEQPLSDIALPQTLAARVEAAQARDRKQTIAIAASFTAEPLEDALAFWMQELELPSMLEFASYGQVFQELLDPASLFSRNKDGFNLILLRFEDWLRDAQATDPEELLARNLADFEKALLAAPQRVPIVLALCPAAPQTQHAARYLQMEQRLQEILAANTNIHLLSSAELAEYYPVADYYDPQTDELGHMPYTPAMYTALATAIARKLYLFSHTPHKVIVLDCDNTLWQGVCGEDGAQGVHIDAPHRALQEFMAAQQSAGKLLCLASKNDERDVWAVFDRRGDMLLKREQLVAWRINWQPKSQNLRELATELNLGLDSFIFVDDNPLECAEVRANCPDVFVVELPQEPELIPQLLRHTWAFDQRQVTTEDRRRTQMYQENSARHRAKAESLTFAAFIESLELKIDIRPLEPALVPRVSQLTQRTNQFNTTTLRRSEAEVAATPHCRVVEVRDRFGDYGLVGAMFYAAGQDSLEVDSLLLSCRALGRGVEERMLSWLGEEAARQGLGRVDLRYLPSPKNRPVLDFLQKVGPPDGAFFRFPLALLVDLPGRLSDGAVPADEQEVARPASQRTTAHTQLERIARELWQPEQILEEIRLRKPVQQRKGTAAYEAPSTPAEEALAEIWKQVLGVEQVGVHDNFFEAGGDSLQVMRVVARAHQAGLHFSPQDFFKYQTVAQLAAHGTSTKPAQAEQTVANGLLPLTVAQKGFFSEEPLYPDYWNLPTLIEVPAEIKPDAVEAVVRYLWTYHDALRTRFVHTGQDGWQQIIPAADENLPVPFAYYDFSDLPASEHTEAIERTAQELQKSLNILEGPLMRVALFSLGENCPGRLFVILHHLIYDASSGIFFDDFYSLFQQISRGEPFHLPPKTTPISHWLEKLSAYTRSPELQQELGYWLSLPWANIRPLPVDYPENRENNTWASAHSLPARLSPEETTVLLREIPKAYGVQPIDILITALVESITAWSGQGWSMFSMVDFGRNVIPNAADLDLSRTVGWFAIDRRLVLQREQHSQPVELLKSIQLQLQNMPSHGLSYELLLYGNQNKDAVEKLQQFRRSEIAFNYLGRQRGTTNFKQAYEYPGPACDPRNQRPYLLDCSVLISGGRLVTNWRYSKNIHKPATIKILAEGYIHWLQTFIAQYASGK